MGKKKFIAFQRWWEKNLAEPIRMQNLFRWRKYFAWTFPVYCLASRTNIRSSRPVWARPFTGCTQEYAQRRSRAAWVSIVPALLCSRNCPGANHSRRVIERFVIAEEHEPVSGFDHEIQRDVVKWLAVTHHGDQRHAVPPGQIDIS